MVLVWPCASSATIPSSWKPEQSWATKPFHLHSIPVKTGPIPFPFCSYNSCCHSILTSIQGATKCGMIMKSFQLDSDNSNSSCNGASLHNDVGTIVVGCLRHMVHLLFAANKPIIPTYSPKNYSIQALMGICIKAWKKVCTLYVLMLDDASTIVYSKHLLN